MIESSTISALGADAAPRRKEEAREASPQFSYALAAASLEARASKSLEAHGASPDSGGVKAGAAENGQEKSAPTKSNSPQTQTRAPEDNPASGRNPAAAHQAAEKATKIAIGTPTTPAQPFAPAAASALSSSAAPLKAAETAGAVRDISSATSKLAAAKLQKPQPAPTALTAEFAEILAKRLEKTSVFELRLDPPDLGRVDGKLVVDDDGKAVLSLTFDNKNAFDLYARDEQALRHALQQAGLSFDAGDFNLSYREPVAAGANANNASAETSPAAVSYEAAYQAVWSAGALDIRI